MSQENVEIVRRVDRGVNRRDMDALLALSDVEIEFQSIFAESRPAGSSAGTQASSTTSRRWMTPTSGSRSIHEDFIDAGAIRPGDCPGLSGAGGRAGLSGTTAIFVASTI